MNELLIDHLFATIEQANSYTATEFDWPETPFGQIAFFGGFTLLIVFAIWMYIRDTRAINVLWRPFLLLLRLAVIVGLAVIILNPQERTQRMSHRPSRVAVLVDTSLSMKFPQAVADDGSSESIASRAEAVRRVLADSELIHDLRKLHDVSLYTFDSKLEGPHEVLQSLKRTPADDKFGNSPNSGDGESPDVKDPVIQIDYAELLRPRGVETRLGESLNDLIRDISGRTLSGIVVISDGGSNAGIEASGAHDLARQTLTRLVTVGVGSIKQPINLSVASIQAPTDVHLGDPYEITALIQGQGLAGRTVKVELLVRTDGDKGKPTLLETRDVQLPEDAIPAEIKFARTPAVAGNVEFLVRASTANRVVELTSDDNERRKSINIFERKTRVLLMAGGPMRDYRFVRNMLFRHPAMQVDVWLQTVDRPAARVSQDSDKLLDAFPPDAATLFDYDVILAFDADWRLISLEQQQMLSDWVSRHAGGIVFIAGDVHTPQLASAADQMESVHELFPVFLDQMPLDFQSENRRTQPWAVDFTSNGREAGFLLLSDKPGASVELWKEFEGVYHCYPTGGAKAGATVFAHFSDPTSQTEHGQPILIATQFYGAGRTMFLGTPELWRLRAVSDEYYDRFWIKVIREIGQGRTERGQSRGLLLLERNSYVLGQTIRIRAQLYDPQMSDLDLESTPIEIFDPDGNLVTPARRLRMDSTRVGQYTGSFRASRQGTWRIELPVPLSDERLTRKIDVVLPNLESDNPQQNAGLLTSLADGTGGQYLSIERVTKELPALLPDRGEQVPIDERLKTLWDRGWVMYLLIGLLSLEWLTRKLLKLA
jgi:hypothetical protein